jgi:hypothetical protein
MVQPGNDVGNPTRQNSVVSHNGRKYTLWPKIAVNDHRIPIPRKNWVSGGEPMTGAQAPALRLSAKSAISRIDALKCGTNNWREPPFVKENRT